ncbi:hypothetical protein [Pukyongiella litopenaei]|uniref:Sel1 repeat family protein n=1 Tax=Pukyongiella litopenaei TaxID=2605946 RepID=A0A2S0MMF6_9RHOB|nr:hypothetical protein [Pukyongiella litopenaei]AVO37007.1 hypothetical protein C6Y53_04350 [Pukyongiella litopenaei]
MSLSVQSDPEEPAGGYAFLELPVGTLPDGAVTVAVFDAYGERWLGDGGAESDGWRPERHDFGPYEVWRHDGADWVRIGPEIVDRLEEYQSLRFSLGGRDYDLNWPDNVPPRAPAAQPGILQVVSRPRPVAKPDVPVVRPAPPAPRPDPEPDPLPEPAPQPDPVATSETDAGRRRLWPLLLLLLLGTAAAAGWWFYGRDAEPDPATPVADTDPAAGPASGDACTLSALSALKGGFAVIGPAMRGCGTRLSAEHALRLVEDAAARNEAGALLLFGTLYDGDELDPRVENLIGLSFDDDPAKAAEYYARAARAGSQQAPGRLDAVCGKLAAMDTTLAKGALDDYCR